jgi:hypothetical protein
MSRPANEAIARNDFGPRKNETTATVPKGGQKTRLVLVCVGSALSSPRRHRRFLSDNDPCPLATLAQQRVELGAAHGDDATVGERHGTARRIRGGYQLAFRD